jgi:hypothetical protein
LRGVGGDDYEITPVGWTRGDTELLVTSFAASSYDLVSIPVAGDRSPVVLVAGIGDWEQADIPDFSWR